MLRQCFAKTQQKARSCKQDLKAVIAMHLGQIFLTVFVLQVVPIQLKQPLSSWYASHAHIET